MSRWVWREFRRIRRSAQRSRKTPGFAFSDSRLEERTMLSLVTGVVSDVNQVAGSPTPTNLTAVGNKLFFTTPNSPSSTATLWESSGGSSGAVALSSIDEPNGGLPSNSPPFVALNGDVYFISSDQTGWNSQGLYKTDGTQAGTTEVTSLFVDGGNPTTGNLTSASGKVFFTETVPSGIQLWESDATEGGTNEVSAFPPNSSVIEMIGQGSSVYFTVETADSDGSDTPQLWTSDGTSAGTVQLTKFTEGSQLNALTVSGSKIFFVGNDGTNGDELWATNGTPAGTTQLTHFDNLSMAGSIGSNDPLAVADGSLYFAMYDGSNNTAQVWTSDGTASGTVPVMASGGMFENAGDFTAVGKTVFFVGEYASESSPLPTAQLWAASAGTAAPVTPNVNWVSGPTALTALNNSTLLFGADDGSGHGEELWKSNGTASGTTMVSDINPGSGGSLSYSNAYTIAVANGDSPNAFTAMNGVAYFIANDGSDGQELWKSDGTAAGTAMVSDIAPGSPTSSLQSLTDVDGELYFVASEGPGSNQLWMSDGTAAGTSLVQNIAQTQNQVSYPTILGAVNGSLYFSATDGVDGQQLWKTDQTAADATMVTDFPQNSSGFFVPGSSNVVGLGGSIYFEVGGGGPGSSAPTIYKSNGTAAGSGPIFTGDSSAIQMSGLTVSGNALYFLTSESNSSGAGLDLWKSDGTASGTSLVKSIPNSGSNVYSLTTVNGKVFFTIIDGTFGSDTAVYQLWSSDGTAAGTAEVTSLRGPIDQDVALGNELIFTEQDSTDSTESLWASDGTAAGTVQLQDFQPSGNYRYGSESLQSALVVAAPKCTSWPRTERTHSSGPPMEPSRERWR